MLEPNPLYRISAKECLNHAFFDPFLKLQLEVDYDNEMNEKNLMTETTFIHLFYFNYYFYFIYL